jgi:glycosyltransferase involved in cell wall biosynthesis
MNYAGKALKHTIDSVNCGKNLFMTIVSDPPAKTIAALPKTILYVDHTAKMGGGEIALLNLVSALDTARYRPLVALAADGPLAEKLRAAGIETTVLPLDPALRETRKDSLGAGSLLKLRQAGLLLSYSLRLARWARAHSVDLIHTNSLKSDIYGGIAGRLAGIPVLWHVRDNINGEYLPPLVASAFRLVSRLLPQMVVANSTSTLNQLWPKRAKSGAVVYSGVTMEVVHDGYVELQALAGGLNSSTEWERPPVIALIGRIAEWKGQHVFLRAASAVRERFPEARFWIIGAPLFGEFDYERSLHTLTEQLGMTESVEYLGFRDDVAQLMPEIDIVVHASILGEPFGQVVIEGMAAGKPLVATDGGALPEIVVPGETGYLVAMGSAEEMAAAISRLLSNPVQARIMGQAGRRRVRRLFTMSHTVRKVEAVYDRLFARREADPAESFGVSPQT